MKKNNKILCLMLSLIMILSLLPAMAFAAASNCQSDQLIEGYYEYADLYKINKCKHCKGNITWVPHASNDFLWAGSCESNGCDCTYLAGRCYDDDDCYGAYVLYSKSDKCPHCGSDIDWELDKKTGIWEGDCEHDHDDDDHECDCDFVLYSEANVPGAAARSEFNIEVDKNWNDQGNEDKRPASVEITLKANGQITEMLTLTAANNWKGEFKNKPILGADGKAIRYTVQESEASDYTVRYVQPAASISLQFGNKVTPAAQSNYFVNGNVIVANKGNEYYIWTENALNQSQKLYLLNTINEANMDGLGKKLTLSNTSLKNGLPAYFSNNSIRIISSGNNKKIYFDNTNAWSLFYVGVLDIEDKASATITNTYSPSPTPSVTPEPTPSETPEPTLGGSHTHEDKNDDDKCDDCGYNMLPVEVPTTGDDSNPLLYGVLMLLALAGIAVTTVISKRKKA